MNTELVANFWPAIDSTSGLIQRVLARAHLVSGGDDVFSSTLLSLAPQDYLLATAFRIPTRFPNPDDHTMNFLQKLKFDLTIPEFQHILSTFPLVDESVKSQTLNTYRELVKLGKFA
jgi:hypothetical protein